MARRTTSPTKNRAASRRTADTDTPKQTAAEGPRRGRKAKLAEASAAQMSAVDAFFPGGADDVGASDTDPTPNELIKAGRGRKPKAQPSAEPLTTADAVADAIGSPTTDGGDAVENEAASNEVATPESEPPSVPPSPKRRGPQKRAETPSPVSTETGAVPSPSATPAARWDAETGTATFDWPSIEKVAAAEGPNQTMAKLLLAARAEGANSRWPF